MQVTAIVMPTAAAQPDPVVAVPEGDGEWAALMASFAVQETAEPVAEDAAVLIEDSLAEATTPDATVPNTPPLPIFLTEEPTPVFDGGTAAMAETDLPTLPLAAAVAFDDGDLDAAPVALPEVEVGALLDRQLLELPKTQGEAQPDPQAVAPPTAPNVPPSHSQVVLLENIATLHESAPAKTVARAETPPIQPDAPDAAAPSDSVDPPPPMVAQVLPTVPTVRRTAVENLWQMQGLIPAARKKDETMIAVEQPKVAAEIAVAMPDLVPTETLAPLVLTSDMERPGTLQLTPDLQLLSGASHRISLPLLPGHTPVVPHSAPTFAPEFLNLIKSQAAAPSDGGVTLTLAPVELGELRMSMVQDGDSLRVSITADRPETLDLLRRNSEQLGQELRQAGFHSTSFSFAQSGQGDQRPDAKAAERAWEGGSEPMAHDRQITESPRHSLTASGGLDLRM